MPAPAVVVVDDFFTDPDAVRQLALAQPYDESAYHKGRRSRERFLHLVDPAVFGQLLRRQVTAWESHGMNGRFQLCLSTDPIVYHSDMQTHAGIVFLTPDAPACCGLALYRSKVTGLRRPPADQATATRMYDGNLYDRTKWEEIDRIGNLYNRLVLWDGQLVHAPAGYFGNALENGRLFQIFFFDTSAQIASTP